MPRGPQRGGKEGAEETAAGAGDGDLPGRECFPSLSKGDRVGHDMARAGSPSAVATLERDFEQTLAFYTLEGIPREWIRTTSLLERTNRELRRKFRQAVTFGSQAGAQVAIFLQVQRLHAQWSQQTWWDISHSLSFQLWNLNP